MIALRRLEVFSPVVSVVCIGLFLASGIYAVRGSLFDDAVRPIDLRNPAWIGKVVSNGSFPAYYVGRDSASVPVGRVVVGDEGLDLIPFADTWARLGGAAAVDRVRIHILPTDVKALWATVPQAAKLELATRAEALARYLQNNVVSIVGSPKFARRYEDVFRAIGSDAYRAIWDDPRYRLIEATMADLYRPEDGEELAGVIMPIVLPELRDAIIDMLTPHWGNVRTLLLEGRIDPKPFRDAAGRVLMNEKLHEAFLSVLKKTVSNPSVWRVSALVFDIYVENVTSDPRFETLVADLVRDPEFADQIRGIEVELTRFSTGAFDLVVERGDDDIPDTLAMRMLRYILLNRISAVAIVLDEDDPHLPFVEQYLAARRSS